MISGFHALRQARAELEHATEGSFGILGQICYPLCHRCPRGIVGGMVDSESALRSARILLSRVRAPTLAPWPDGGPESLRSPCCGLAVFKKINNTVAKDRS
ncbi:hypothetical protein PoB_005060200 [Plakobranchus ocellatus]|uniref:Uncharacterized protein n=1 Tax=Plakobranchus ocellatus TaxID=259542 RepID=A0AAV4BY76_9GAST|nr:hypothetical protein PoB_005060200 [Plakobranchus ocellatus]